MENVSKSSTQMNSDMARSIVVLAGNLDATHVQELYKTLDRPSDDI